MSNRSGLPHESRKLVTELLCWVPGNRLQASEAAAHSWFFETPFPSQLKEYVVLEYVKVPILPSGS